MKSSLELEGALIMVETGTNRLQTSHLRLQELLDLLLLLLNLLAMQVLLLHPQIFDLTIGIQTQGPLVI